MKAYKILVTFFDFEKNDFVIKNVISLTNDAKELEKELISQDFVIRYFLKNKNTLDISKPKYLYAGLHDDQITDEYESTFRFFSEPIEVTLPCII